MRRGGDNKKGSYGSLYKPLFLLVGRVRFERTTNRLKVTRTLIYTFKINKLYNSMRCSY